MKPERDLCWLEPLVVFATALAMGVVLLMHRLETGGDNLDFLLMAKSIQLGQWGDIIGWPRPAGYSFFILGVLGSLGLRLDGTVLFTLAARAIYALKFAGVGVFALSAVAVYAWGRRVLGERRWALGLALLFATNQHLASWCSVIGAEALFILLAMLALYLWETYASREEAAGRRPLWGYVVLATLCMFTKYQGLMVGASFGLWVLLFRRRSPGAWLAGFVLLAFFLVSIGLMFIGNPFCLTHVVASDPYGHGVEITWLARIRQALGIYTLSWPDLVAPKIFGSYGILALAGWRGPVWPLTALLLGVLLAGLVATLRRSVRPSHVFLLSFYALLFAWPDFLFRYLVPLLPFGLWFLVEGLLAAGRALARRVPALGGKRLPAVLLGLLIVWNLGVNAYAGLKNWRNIADLRDLPAWAPERYRISREDDFAEYMEGCGWFRDHAEPEAIVFSRKALFAELAAQRHCLYYSSYGTPGELLTAMQASARNVPTYVVRDTFHPASTYGLVRDRLLTPLIESHASGWTLVQRFDSGVEIYRIPPHEP